MGSVSVTDLNTSSQMLAELPNISSPGAILVSNVLSNYFNYKFCYMYFYIDFFTLLQTHNSDNQIILYITNMYI